MRFLKLVIVTVCYWSCGTTTAQTPIKIMYYNLLKFPGTTPERADTLAVILGHVGPDVLVVNELFSEAGADMILNRALPDGFKRAAFRDGPDTDNMLFFDAEKLALKSQSQIETSLRDISEYVLYWSHSAAQADTAFLAVYAMHLKASPGSENEARRKSEVDALLNHLETIRPEYNIIVGGDCNFYDGSEGGYEALSKALVDPLSQGANSWHDNVGFADIHTQSTRTDQFGGGATGGMDDRFDFIFLDERLIDGNRVFMIENSYEAVGQDGSRFNGSMISPVMNGSVPQNIATALYHMSDHLPVTVQIGRNDYAGSIESHQARWPYFIRNGALHITTDKPTTLHLYDLQGRLLLSQHLTAGDQVVDLDHGQGVGILHLTDGDTHFARLIAQ